jgi:hypothetical protein
MERLGSDLARRLRDALLAASGAWARRGPVDERVLAAIRHRLILNEHLEHVEAIPAYRRIAEEEGLSGSVGLGDIVRRLLIGTGWFKSYDPRRLEEGDFAAMSEWVAEISSCRPAPPGEDVRSVGDWIADLRRQGIHVSTSSGTGGRPSFVPRDRETFAALAGNGRHYGGDGTAAVEDCLVLLPRSGALGLQQAAHGLARRAARTHFLSEDAHEDWRGERLDGAVAFLRDAARAGRSVTVFGTPFHVEALCAALADEPLVLPPGSAVVTGGGWKGRAPVAAHELRRRLRAALGVAGDRALDGYSAAELNCVLTTCAHGRYHVPPVVEAVVVDAALEPLPGGEGTGTPALLDPFARSYPGWLLTGDRAHLTREPCPCGLAGPSIAGEITRAPDFEPKGCAAALAEAA